MTKPDICLLIVHCSMTSHLKLLYDKTGYILYCMTEPDLQLVYDKSGYLSDFSIDSLFLDFLRAQNLYKKDELRSGTFSALGHHPDRSFSAK